MHTSNTCSRTLVRLAAAAALAALLPFSASSSTATAAGIGDAPTVTASPAMKRPPTTYNTNDPAGRPKLPPEARGRQPRKPPEERGRRHSHAPRSIARMAQFNSVGYGQTQCPTVSPPGTLNSALITAPLIFGNSGDWFQFWNGVATAASNWQTVSWDGPYWVQSNSLTSPIYNPRNGSWTLGMYGGGSTRMTWPVGTAALGEQYIVDVSTGQVRRGWTRAMNSSGGTCSNF